MDVMDTPGYLWIWISRDINRSTRISMDIHRYSWMISVPKILKKVHEEGVPVFLQRSVEDKEALEKLDPEQRYSSETTARQVFDRLAGAWAYWGWKGHYFDSERDA